MSLWEIPQPVRPRVAARATAASELRVMFFKSKFRFHLVVRALFLIASVYFKVDDNIVYPVIGCCHAQLDGRL
jgi:hypothetical protein